MSKTRCLSNFYKAGDRPCPWLGFFAFGDTMIRTPGHGRGLQPAVILIAAIAQIASARLTDFLHLGVSVELRSAMTSHPLVPFGPAFAIWGVIYLWALIAAIWQVLPEQRHNRALAETGWNFAAIYLINTIWQVWVPFHGFDWISTALTAAALIIGVSGTLRLRQDIELSHMDTLFVFAPLALVTGWLSAAACVNFTSMLVAGGFALDPVNANVSLGFLMALVAFGAVMVWLSESLAYSAAVIWALFWIMIGNIARDHEPSMVTTSLIGMALIGLMCVWAVTHHHQSGPMQLRRG